APAPTPRRRPVIGLSRPARRCRDSHRRPLFSRPGTERSFTDAPHLQHPVRPGLGDPQAGGQVPPPHPAERPERREPPRLRRPVRAARPREPATPRRPSRPAHWLAKKDWHDHNPPFAQSPSGDVEPNEEGWPFGASLLAFRAKAICTTEISTTKSRI